VDLGGLSIVPFAIGGGVLVLALFAWWELRVERQGRTPIVSMRLFRNRQSVSGALIIGVLMLGMNGIVFSLPVFLQSVKNLDAFHTGLALLPMSIMLLIVSPAAATLTKRISPKHLVQAGLALDVVALFVLRASLSPDMDVRMLIPGLVLYGTGQGMVMSQINNLMLSAVPVREAGEASGVGNTFRQVGSALGAAIIGAVLLSTILLDIEGAVASSNTIPAAEKPALDAALREQSSALAFGGAEIFANVP